MLAFAISGQCFKRKQRYHALPEYLGSTWPIRCLLFHRRPLKFRAGISFRPSLLSTRGPAPHVHGRPKAKLTPKDSILRIFPRWASPHTTVLVSDPLYLDRIETRLGFPPSSIDHRKEQWYGYCISGLSLCVFFTFQRLPHRTIFCTYPSTFQLPRKGPSFNHHRTYKGKLATSQLNVDALGGVRTWEFSAKARTAPNFHQSLASHNSGKVSPSRRWPSWTPINGFMI